MTIAVNDRLISHAGDGATLTFAYDFPILADSDLVVVKRTASATTAQTLTTHYSVSIGGDGTGTITFVTAPVSGETVWIGGSRPAEQTADYQNADRFPAEAHEGSMDKLAKSLQEVQRDLGRALLAPLGSTGAELGDESVFQDVLDNIATIEAAPTAATAAAASAAMALASQTAASANQTAAETAETNAEAARDEVLNAVTLSQNIIHTGSMVLQDGERVDFGIRDANDRLSFYVNNLGQAYQGNDAGTAVERILSQKGITDEIERRVKIDVSPRVTEDGTRWQWAVTFANQVYFGMVEVSPGVYEYRAATPNGLRTLATEGGAEIPTYAQDATSLDHVRTNSDYVLVVSIDDSQSNGDGVNPDASDPINQAAPETDGSEAYVLKPSVGVRPEGVRFTELVAMFEDAGKAGTRESALSSICYSLHKRIFAEHGVRVRVIGAVFAQSAKTLEELSRGSVYHNRWLAGHEDIAAICQANGWKPEIVRVSVHGEADLADLKLDYIRSKQTSYRQRSDDLKRIYGIKSDILQVNIQVNAGQPRDPDNVNDEWAPPEPPLAVAELPQRSDWARCAGPIFAFGHSSDNLHLSCDGQSDMGIAIQNVIYHELFSHGWTDWEVDRCVWVSSTVCDVYWSAPAPDLVLNGGGVINMTGSTTTVNGFQAHDYNKNLATISSIAMRNNNAGDAVITRFTFGSAVTSNLWVEIGRRKDGTGSNGPANGGRHILRTTRSQVNAKTGNTVYEWAPCLQIFIGRP